MTKKSTEQKDDKEQSKRFIEKALELGVNESGKSFESALDLINKNTGNGASNGESTSSTNGRNLRED
ncbi:hypothetical protein FT643_06835 [Ketobacter sp. MCCC 1A13808]|uniref:hypothetical protein n=1 Tax=Ketobacter sp. MCCC 1A13808 TaxID=2602738 RepID=UPI0012EC168B|nr:hypothetical protein [Ketobacter sp. MCCC 1A13808]MVF11859.1 hypothetical protein [Ketobacter sp. MCCC 1A13808]